MSLLKKFALPFLLSGLSLQAFEPSCFYDYGYPPPLETGAELGDLFVDAEWLFLKPAVDQLYFAEKGIFPHPTVTIPPVEAHKEAPHFRWDSGVRAFVGYSLPLDQWAIQLSYIYYHTHASHQIKGEGSSEPDRENSYIVPVLAQTFVDFAGENNYKAASQWNWNLNVLDVDLSRISYFNRAFYIRPNAGFRVLWSHQKFQTTYSNLPSNPRNLGLSFDTRNSNGFNAFGVKAGIDTLWNLGLGGFSFFGNFDWSLLTGDLKLRQAFTETEIQTGIEFVSPLKAKNNLRSMKQMLHGAFGIEWETSFDCESIFLVVKAGWEQFYFPNFNQLTGRVVEGEELEPKIAIPYSVQGDMGLYGFSFGATLIF
jgi:hypothetical protein